MFFISLFCVTLQRCCSYRKTKCSSFWPEVNSFYSCVPQKPKTKIGSTFREYLNILFAVPQKSIVGPLLFLIFTGDLFYLNYDLDFASYADDTTLHICGQDFSSIINVLEPNANTLFNWLRQNGLIANTCKSHFLTNYPIWKIHD